MILAHHQALSATPALYPFWRSDIESFTIPNDDHTFMIDSIYHGNVPSKIILGMVANEAYSGIYKTNSFDCLHKNVNYLEITVDGTSVPQQPFKPNFIKNDYLPSYLSLMDSHFNSKNRIDISSSDYPGGYSLFLFDL